MLIIITSHLSFEFHFYYTNTGSYQIAGIYWPHKTICPLTYGIKGFVKCRIQSPVYFDMTKYYLVNSNAEQDFKRFSGH